MLHIQAMSVAGMLFFGISIPGPENEPQKVTGPSLTELSQEIAALQSLYVLNVSPAQMEAWRKLTDETASGAPKHHEVEVTGAFHEALRALRQALVEASDDERISRLLDKCDGLRQAEKADLRDQFDITDEAIQRAPEVLRTLSARQIAAYLGYGADDIDDPSERLLHALTEIRDMSEDDQSELREEVAGQVSELLAGLDEEKAARLNDQVIQLLIVAGTLKKQDFDSERPNLERKVRQIVSAVGPTEILRNIMERDLAQILSNPRLAAALDARLKHRNSAATAAK